MFGDSSVTVAGLVQEMSNAMTRISHLSLNSRSINQVKLDSYNNKTYSKREIPKRTHILANQIFLMSKKHLVWFTGHVT